jgi:hypothetical protein
MNPKAELADLVMDHLSRNVSVATVALASVMTGLASLFQAYDDAQERRGNWGEMLAALRRGVASIQPALPVLRSQGGPGVATVIELAERELPFAEQLQEEIVRLQTRG